MISCVSCRCTDTRALHVLPSTNRTHLAISANFKQAIDA